ncbi:hypothetical protein CDAR_454001 [Caerostris darwini]|uniref:Uncharacterized protein n=1 Tax=Caerostris darwini TaxID=1538125 RepID=A0AAV4V6W0_9ARAC|nr:hypothetical protein CDAR_454001 [Caerostris darwini]
MISTKAMFLLSCLVLAVIADDSKSIDGGFNYDYGRHRLSSENETVKKYPSYVKYYPRKYKPRKPIIVDGLPLYRD